MRLNLRHKKSIVNISIWSAYFVTALLRNIAIIVTKEMITAYLFPAVTVY